MSPIIYSTTVAAALGAGLMGGFFFAFSNLVMPSLRRLTPQAGIEAMQVINEVVLNPIFFLGFFGTALLALVLVAVAAMNFAGSGMPWLLAAGIAYLAGVILVTVFFNVPMNNALAAVDPSSAAGAALWADYLDRWTMWNHVRTVGGLVSSGAFILAVRAAA